MLNTINCCELLVSGNIYCTQSTRCEMQMWKDHKSIAVHGQLGNSNIVHDIENIASRTRHYKNHGANKTTPDILVINNKVASKRPFDVNQKVKYPVSVTVIGKKSITEITSIVDQNKNHMQFISESG